MIPQLSTGDMLRAAIKDKTALGAKAQSYMDQGQLVPDDLILGLIHQRIKASDCHEGYILDGFPRTLVQAEALDEMLAKEDQSLERVIYLEIDPELVVARLKGRRVCSLCGEEYHVDHRPPQKPGFCDKDGAPLAQRPDDQEKSIRVRLEAYHNQTAPLAQYYAKDGRLASVHAEGDIDEISLRILNALGH